MILSIFKLIRSYLAITCNNGISIIAIIIMNIQTLSIHTFYRKGVDTVEMDEATGKRYIRVLDEMDSCIKNCYCHEFSKIRGVDGVIIVRPHDIKDNPADIVYKIFVLSENMNSPEKQIAFLEQLMSEYIAFKNQFEHTSLKASLSVIYTQISNLKNVMHKDDTRVEAYISSKKYGTPNSNEITRGAYGIYVCEDAVHCAMFEKL